jgi:signal peptidase I
MDNFITSYWTYFFVIELLAFIATFPFFKAAGKPVWAAAVPVYRTLILLKLIERPWWWVLMSFMPIVNNVVAIVIIYELHHVFNFRKPIQTFWSVITLGLYTAYLGFTQKPVYKDKDVMFMKKQLGETVTSIFFAVIVATILRTFSFEAYTIPTSSMEKSLMVGDFLFVSKFHYGIRLPQTPLTIPLLHNKIPFTEIPTFSRAVQLPYVRTPKVHQVRRNESVVFNYPMQDSNPVDKRENYIKRCVGLPGDTLQVINRQVHINGMPSEFDYRANLQFFYYVETGGTGLNKKQMKDRFDINFLSREQMMKHGDVGDVRYAQGNIHLMGISEQALPEFKKLPQILKVIPINALPKGQSYPEETPSGLLNYYLAEAGPSNRIFPNPQGHSDSIVFNYTLDNYGPIYLPAKGQNIPLNYENYLRYGRAIRTYENNELEYENGKVILNGQEADNYTFKMDYYWMMGDNRHNSEDSRFWGFVPEDHIVGKPVFIWMSYDKYATEAKRKIRWDRIFTTVHFDGPKRSYFIHFLVLIGLITVANRYLKKKSANKS